MRSLIEHFRHPPWPALFGLSLVGYTISLTAAADIIPVAICGAGTGYLPGSGDLWAAASAILALNSPLSLLTGWCIMLAAMMPTLLAAPIVHVRYSSLVRRRTRAVSSFCTGYALVWLAMAAPLGVLALLLDMVWGKGALPLAVAVALVWNASPVHQHLLNRAHRLPSLRLSGLRADADCLAFGVQHGLLCAAACWAWMLVPLVAGEGHFAIMLLIGIALLAERLSLPRKPRWHAPAIVALLRHLKLREHARVVMRNA